MQNRRVGRWCVSVSAIVILELAVRERAEKDKRRTKDERQLLHTLEIKLTFFDPVHFGVPPSPALFKTNCRWQFQVPRGSWPAMGRGIPTWLTHDRPTRGLTELETIDSTDCSNIGLGSRHQKETNPKTKNQNPNTKQTNRNRNVWMGQWRKEISLAACLQVSVLILYNISICVFGWKDLSLYTLFFRGSWSNNFAATAC